MVQSSNRLWAKKIRIGEDSDYSVDGGCLVAHHAVTKGKECVEHQLEVLHTKGDTDNRAAEDYAECEVRECHLDTAKDNPQHVH